MRLFCFIQCRSDSTRFPGKCFEKINGESLIELCYSACKDVIENTVVLIPADDSALESFLMEKNIPYYKGAKNDVLLRYYNAAIAYNATHIIRVTGDCPYPNKQGLYTIKAIFEEYDNKPPQVFISNCFAPRFIVDGDDVEGMSLAMLYALNKQATGTSEREHVTEYLYVGDDNINHQFIKLINIANRSVDLSMHKTSIDTPEDLERVRHTTERILL